MFGENVKLIGMIIHVFPHITVSMPSSNWSMECVVREGFESPPLIKNECCRSNPSSTPILDRPLS